MIQRFSNGTFTKLILPYAKNYKNSVQTQFLNNNKTVSLGGIKIPMDDEDIEKFRDIKETIHFHSMLNIEQQNNSEREYFESELLIDFQNKNLIKENIHLNVNYYNNNKYLWRYQLYLDNKIQTEFQFLLEKDYFENNSFDKIKIYTMYNNNINKIYKFTYWSLYFYS